MGAETPVLDIIFLIAERRSEFNCIPFNVIGGPGCGKGTQCEQIVSKYNYSHLSTGTFYPPSSLFPPPPPPFTCTRKYYQGM